MSNNAVVYEYQPPVIQILHRDVLQEDFDMLTRAGVRHPVAYGEALRDADILGPNGGPTTRFMYCGQLPEAQSNLGAISLMTANLLRARDVTNVRLRNTMGQYAVHYSLSHAGRPLELTVHTGQPLAAERLALAAPLGINGIATDPMGYIVASRAYVDDINQQWLTINHDMPNADQVKAIKAARELKLRAPFQKFKIVG